MKELNERMAAAKAGDLSSIYELVVEHRDWLSAQIEPRIPQRFRSVLGVEDILQESLYEAVLYFCDFNPEASLRAWLLSIAQNNLIDAVRGLSAIKRGGSIKINSAMDANTLNEPYDELLSLIAGTTTPPSQKLLKKEALEKLDDLLNSLPDETRELIKAYFFSGKSRDAIAQELGISVQALYMRRNRAIRMLRDSAEGKDFSPPR